MLGDDTLGEIRLGSLERRDPGDPQFVHQPVLEGPIQPITADPRLLVIGGNVFDAEAASARPTCVRCVVSTRPLAVGV